MRILVGWNDEIESETLSLILNVDPNEARVVTNGEEFREAWSPFGFRAVQVELPLRRLRPVSFDQCP